MMNNYLKNITADSFSGEVFAFEGIDGVITIVNGPSGCKFYHSATADNQTIKQLEFDPLNFPDKWYFGQPRVPCTYLDTKDYVYGSKDKLVEAIDFLNNNADFDLLCVVNSPGAALIGDNLKDIIANATNKPFIAIESPGYSDNICLGYDNAVVQLIKQLKLKKTTLNNKVNILGLSIYHKNHRGDVLELTRLLKMCGIEVNCFACCECNLETLKDIPNALLNIVVHPEYALNSAKLLEEEFNTPYYVCDGEPVGFKATEKMFTEICELVDANPQTLLIESEKARAMAYAHISRVNSLTGLPKAVPFAVEGTYSQVYAYSSFLAQYFGMILESTSILYPENKVFKEQLYNFLAESNRLDTLDKNFLDTTSELVFANGNTIAQLKLKNHSFSGIEISLPTLGYIDIIPKTHLGINGALLLTEQVLNGLKF